MMKYFILVVIILIILIFIAYKLGQKTCEMDFLQGFWESNSEFNKEAGIHSFTFYIGDKCNGKYPAYLLMIENDSEQTLLINEPTSFSITENYMNLLSQDECKTMQLHFDNIETNLLPCVMTMKYYPQTSKIVLSDHKKIYAVFFKNPVLSEMERIKNEQETQKNVVIPQQPQPDNDNNSINETEMIDVE